MRLYVPVLTFCLAVLVFPAMNPVCGQQTKPPRQPGTDFSCLAGRPGIPGLHGNPGAPGRDGRDGRDGIPGKQGPSGIQGPSGHPGVPGSRGPKGAQGDTGTKGHRGEPGARGLHCYSNWKECSWDAFSEAKDNGLIKECVFRKNFSDTVLHVYWNGNFRIYNCDRCCKRWFFTFDGAECQVPRPIDGIVYMLKGQGHDLHRVRHIEGHCDKIPQGNVRVGFNVGNCAGFGNADAHTGDTSTSRLFIQEVPRPQP